MGYTRYVPQALEAVIRMVATRTPGGRSGSPRTAGTEDDTRRVAFIKRAVEGVQNCLADGLDVRSYIHWSLLDNWEGPAATGPSSGWWRWTGRRSRGRPSRARAILVRSPRRGGWVARPAGHAYILPLDRQPETS